MPAWYQIDKERGIVMSTVSGIITRSDLIEHQKRLLADPDFRPGFCQLMDFTHVAKLDVSEADVRILAQKAIFSPNSRRAILVRDDAHYELAELFRTVREIGGEHGIGVFRELDDALDWLARMPK
jgi:hypothetical protein